MVVIFLAQTLRSGPRAVRNSVSPRHMASITPGGDSRGWLQSGENTKRIFELFSAQDDELDGTDWDSVPETTLCSEEVYERMAHWLVLRGSEPHCPLAGLTHPQQC